MPTPDEALDFAIRFVEGFEDDETQEGVSEAIRTLRADREQGYRLPRQS